MKNIVAGTPSQQASARAHIDRRSQWVSGSRKSDGREFWIMPSSNRQAAYYVAKDGQGCSCEGSRRYPICSHQLAAQMVAPKARPSYADIFPACITVGCTEIAEGQDRLCDRCASTREWEARRASRKEGAA